MNTANDILERMRGELAPSIVVFLISLPLSMGIAIASGMPPASGLVTAIIGGLVIGALAGSPLQISGPSAGLAVMVLDAVNSYGAQALAVIVIVMGILQAAAGIFKLGQIFRAVSPAVINGMLAGIGILILSAQVHVMVDDSPKASGLENLITIPEAIVKGLSPAGGSAHFQAAQLGLLTLGVMIVFGLIKRGPLSYVPPPLAAVGTATLAAWLGDMPVRYVTMPESLLAALVPPSGADFANLASPAILGTAIALTFVASAETLLCANAVDGMHEGPRTDYDKELFAQGVGNTVCGLVGALPTTGVITRSTANVQAGAKSRTSVLMLGTWILLAMLIAPRALEVVPTASLAALLVHIGFKLVRTRPLAELRQYGRSEIFIFVATVVTIVVINLLTGILFGIALAAAKLIYSGGQSFHRLDIDVEDDADSQRIHLHLRGAASFFRLPRLAAALESMPTDREVHLHVEDLEYIDHAVLDLLERWERDRLKERAPVRVQWNTLHRRYHAKNIDSAPEQSESEAEVEEHLLDFLTPECILVEPAFSDKWDAIEKLSRHLVAANGLGIRPNTIVASAVARERESSTCIGQGLMIPHGTLDEGLPLSGVMAISKNGWDFGAPDGEPVRCIVLLGTPDSEASHHLAVLGAFARLFMAAPDLRESILGAKTRAEVYALLHSEEAEAINYLFEKRSA